MRYVYARFLRHGIPQDMIKFGEDLGAPLSVCMAKELL